MIKLSEAIQISSNTSEEVLKEVLKDMIEMLEEEFWVSIEKGYEGNSYWIPTPKEELEEDSDDIVGIIEIDIELTTFEKICALAHELGHYFLDQDEDFWKDTHLIFKESLAWYLGYKYFKESGCIIDLEEYRQESSRCLELYVRSLNESSDNK